LPIVPNPLLERRISKVAMTARRASAIAHANIALAKYWGKLDVSDNLPAVPSLSLTLDALSTKTTVSFRADLERDELVLDGAPASGRPLARVSELLDRVRERAGLDFRARVTTENNFPTASGLASSASGFCALALAASAAAGLTLDLADASALARASSASAARSVYGGFASLDAGARAAERVAPPEHFPLVMLVAMTSAGEKTTSSTEGMHRTAQTSPYYGAWLEHAPRIYAEVHAAVLARDFAALGVATEQSALMMHASMLAARPALLYFSPVTLAVVKRIRALREQSVLAFYTMDAGPHVKVLALTADAERVASALGEVPGVLGVIRAAPGPDARLVDS
jgi:diphosphomevalonate decarboxylase